MLRWDWVALSTMGLFVMASILNGLASRYTRDVQAQEIARQRGFLTPLSLYTSAGVVLKTAGFATLLVALGLLYEHFVSGFAMASLSVWPEVIGAIVLWASGVGVGMRARREMRSAEAEDKYRYTRLLAPLGAFTAEGRKYQIVARVLAGLAGLAMLAAIVMVAAS